MNDHSSSQIKKKVEEVYRKLKKKGSVAEPTAKEELITKIADYMLAQSNIPAKYLDQDLSDLNLSGDQKKMCDQIIHAYKDSLRSNLEEGQGAYLWASGNEKNRWGTGTGKTSLAVMLIKEIKEKLAEYVYDSLDRRQREALENQSFTTRVWEHNIFLSQHIPYYITGAKYFQDLQMADSFEKKRLKARASKAIILIWDDFGTEKIEWYHDEMFTLLNTRIENKRPIIFTSNWNFDIFAKEEYKKNSAKMKERGGRLASRIAGMVKSMVFRMEGEDWRMKDLKNINW